MITSSELPTYRAFRRGDLALEGFDHRGHLEVAYGYLRDDPFHDAAAAVGGGLRGYLARAGCPDRYHATLTLAFLALVHERLVVRGDPGSFAAFLDQNPDLMGLSLVRARWGDTLEHPLARRYPLMPGAERPSPAAAEAGGRADAGAEGSR